MVRHRLAYPTIRDIALLFNRILGPRSLSLRSPNDGKLLFVSISIFPQVYRGFLSHSPETLFVTATTFCLKFDDELQVEAQVRPHPLSASSSQALNFTSQTNMTPVHTLSATSATSDGDRRVTRSKTGTARHPVLVDTPPGRSPVRRSSTRSSRKRGSATAATSGGRPRQSASIMARVSAQPPIHDYQ